MSPKRSMRMPCSGKPMRTYQYAGSVSRSSAVFCVLTGDQAEGASSTGVGLRRQPGGGRILRPAAQGIGIAARVDLVGMARLEQGADVEPVALRQQVPLA